VWVESSVKLRNTEGLCCSQVQDSLKTEICTVSAEFKHNCSDIHTHMNVFPASYRYPNTEHIHICAFFNKGRPT